MKKTKLILFAIIAIIVTVIFVKYYSYKTEYNSVIKENAEFEQYSEIYGLELATLINKTIDKNVKNKVAKDENGLFIPNEENSIQIEIYMHDNEKTYKMETLYNAGMEKFVQYYSNIKFKCSEIKYHKKTGKIKYLSFEQIVTS